MPSHIIHLVRIINSNHMCLQRTVRSYTLTHSPAFFESKITEGIYQLSRRMRRLVYVIRINTYLSVPSIFSRTRFKRVQGNVSTYSNAGADQLGWMTTTNSGCIFAAYSKGS